MFNVIFKNFFFILTQKTSIKIIISIILINYNRFINKINNIIFIIIKMKRIHRFE